MNRSLFKVFFLRAFTLTAILTLSVIGAFSQEEKTDSLMSLLRNEEDIDARIIILNELHQATYQNNPGASIAYPREIVIIAQKESLKDKLPNAYQKIAMSYVLLNEIDSAIFYLNEAISVSKEINDRRAYASATRTLGTAYWYKNDINTAIEHYKKSLQIFEELEDKQQIATTVANLGTAYHVLSDFSKSIDYYQQALEMIDHEKYPDEASAYYNDIGTIYKEWGNRTKALEYFMTALEINSRINNKRYKSANLENIGSIYFEESNYDMALYYFNEAFEIEKEIDNIYGMAQSYVTLSSIHMKLSNIDSCFYYLRNALKCYNHVDDKLGLANTYNKFGEVYLINKNYKRSLNHFNMAAEIFEEIGNEKGLAEAYAGTGNSYYLLGNYEKAEKYYMQSVDIALKGNIVYVLMNNYKKLAKISEATNNSKKEADFLKQYINIKDTIYQQEKQKQVSELLERFDSERKENEIVLLNQQNEINQNRLFRQRVITTAVVVLLILTALGVFLLFTRYKQKKRVNLLLQNKNKEIEEKQIKIEAQNLKLENQAEKLKELDEMKSRFFTNVSHEFRTPLTLILGPVEQLIEKIENPNAKASLFSVKYNAQKLLGLINQLLNISKIEKGMVKMRLSKGNICEHVVFITEMFSSQINEKGLSLEVICNDKPLIGDFDKEKIEHICLNLLSNAIKNTDEGKITVSIMKSEETGWVRIRVSDTGKGIEKKKIPFVFDRFYMADETEKAGSGIGLAFTHELIKIYKGNVFVDSEMGKGTTFTVDLPFSKSAFE
ncbi:MAG: tetratricopeptide repeat-containing sensor histidine kinase, partial [Bacteroidales bacterium]